jgi:branched-chain amino acid transport system permease protein
MRAAHWSALVLLLAAPLLLGSQALGLMVQMGIAVVLCMSFWLLMGQGGMVSFGHALYSGLGAFAAIHVLRALGMSGSWGPVPAGLLLPLLPLVGGLAAALMAWVFGWLATRHDSGTAFAMITLGLGELVWAGAQMFPSIFGGEAGITANRSAGASLGWWNWGPVWQIYLLTLIYSPWVPCCRPCATSHSGWLFWGRIRGAFATSALWWPAFLPVSLAAWPPCSMR